MEVPPGVPLIPIHGIPLQSKRKIGIEWDKALEDMLSRPITPNLEAQRILWKKASLLNADPRFDISLDRNRPKVVLRDVRTRAKEEKMKSRQVVVTLVITAPLSPRKNEHYEVKCLSTRTADRPKSAIRDRRDVEHIVHQRQRHAQAVGVMRPARKSDGHNIAREHRIKVNPAVVGAFEGRSQCFFWTDAP
jgi:hypothetical protein